MGPARVKKLEQAGITDVESLAEANPERLAAAAGFSEGVANTLVSAAKDALGGRR